MDWYRQTVEGLEVFVRVTPKSSRDAIEGLEMSADGKTRLKARVRAVPEDGKANKAVCELVARSASLSKSSVQLSSGTTSRNKSVFISCDEGEVAIIVAKLVGKSG
ncbi:MAG: DUF167 family protein [Nitratireductor sp.]